MDAPLGHAQVIKVGWQAVTAKLDVASVAFHRVGLATACLSVGENCAMVSLG